MIYNIYFEFEVLQLLQMLSHIKKINRERQGYVVCYSTEDMADRVNQGNIVLYVYTNVSPIILNSTLVKINLLTSLIQALLNVEPPCSVLISSYVTPMNLLC